MKIRLNEMIARAVAGDISSDHPELKVCVPNHRDPGTSGPWQWTVRVDCRRDDPDWKTTVDWAKSNEMGLMEWRDINDTVRGIEIIDVPVSHPCCHVPDPELPPGVAPWWLKQDP